VISFLAFLIRETEPTEPTGTSNKQQATSKVPKEPENRHRWMGVIPIGPGSSCRVGAASLLPGLLTVLAYCIVYVESKNWPMPCQHDPADIIKVLRSSCHLLNAAPSPPPRAPVGQPAPIITCPDSPGVARMRGCQPYVPSRCPLPSPEAGIP
jgi:hypothetical protein